MHFTSDLFDMLGGGLAGRQRRGPRKEEPIVQALVVTLEDLYNGKTSKFQLTKKVLCPTCNGKGGKEGAVRPCEKCDGEGTEVILRPIGPGMAQQMHVQCEKCLGRGEIINEKDKCQECDGRKTVEEVKLITAEVKPGMRDGQKIIFYGEGNQKPNVENGDVVLVVRAKPHDTFQRQGDDLIIRKKITLKEALCGHSFNVQHLDDRTLLMSTIPGEVVQPGAIRSVLGEGMPKSSGNGRGNLYLVFDIQFPPSHFLELSQYEELESVLPRRQLSKVPSDAEEVMLEEYDPRAQRSRQTNYEEDSDSEDMPQPVRCAQQ